jgi:hypothetical protein
MRRTVRQLAALLASIIVAACAANPGKSPVQPVDEMDLQQGFALKGNGQFLETGHYKA